MVAGCLVFAFVFIIILTTTAKKPIEWKENFHKTDKSPYGSLVFYEVYSQTVEKDKWKEVNIPMYEWLLDSIPEGSLFLFNSSLDIGEFELEKLLHWVENGSTVFLSAHALPEVLLDSLGLEITSVLENDRFEGHLLLNLTAEELKSENGYKFEKPVNASYFSTLDSINTNVLGTVDFEFDEESEQMPLPNYISIQVGDGQILLHTFPVSFSNYFLLNPELKSYTESILSYIPKGGTVYYDNYQKDGKEVYSSPLYLIFANPQLKSAYYCLIILLVIWAIFEGKRKQRPIPIIKPLTNQSLAFAKTIAGMYLEKDATTEIGKLQISLFWEYCRSHFRITFHVINPDTVCKIALLGNCPIEKTEEIFHMLQLFETKTSLSTQEVIKSTQLIDTFKSYQNERGNRLIK
jgi:hypothetical protein